MSATKIETLFNHIQNIFNNKGNWQKNQTSPKKVCFNNLATPYDEYVIESPSSYEINVSIPLNQVAYKKTFHINNDAYDTILNYVKMHLDYYEINKHKQNITAI